MSLLPTETQPDTDTIINKNEALPTALWLQLSIITRDIFPAAEWRKKSLTADLGLPFLPYILVVAYFCELQSRESV